MAEASRQQDDGMEDLLASIRRIISQEAPGEGGDGAPTGETLEPREFEDVAERLARSNLDADRLPELVEQSIREAFAGEEPPAEAARPTRETTRAAGAEAAAARPGGEPRRASPIEGRRSWPGEAAPQRAVRAVRPERRPAGEGDGGGPTFAVPRETAASGPASGGDRPREERPEAGEDGMDEHAMKMEPEFAGEERAEERNVFRRAQEASRGAGREDALLSDRTEQSVGQAFESLSRTILSNNPRTLEDLVRDMLRPMLREWMDRNLPDIVERMVRQEIERLTARGR